MMQRKIPSTFKWLPRLLFLSVALVSVYTTFGELWYKVGLSDPLSGSRRYLPLCRESEEMKVKVSSQPEELRNLPCFNCLRYDCEVPEGVGSLALNEVPVVATATNVTPPDAAIVYHNRVNKCGSSTMNKLLTSLSRRNKNSFLVLNGDRILTRTEQKKHLDELHGLRFQEFKPYKEAIFSRHVAFFNVTRFGYDPFIWTNIIRHPVDRHISMYHFIRTYCKGDEQWRRKDFNECVLQNDRECLPQKGKMRVLQLTYFCGNHPACMQIGNRDALQRAKRHIENYYSVVGVLEHLRLSLLLMEKYVPKFFKTISKVYGNGIQLNRQRKRASISNITHHLLSEALSEDIELYEFVTQRLFLQARAVGLGMHVPKEES